MSNGNNKTLVEEVVETMMTLPNDIGTTIGQYRVLAWFSPLKNDPSYLMRMISMLSKRMDWEIFEPGTTPLIAVHAGSIYSYKEFAFQHTGLNEADAIVLGTSTKPALELMMSIIESLNLDHFVKFEQSEDAIAVAMHVLPLIGLLTCDTWIEPHTSTHDSESVDRKNELSYGLEVKRPRDSIEGDLFSATMDEPESLKVLLKIMARKPRRRPKSSDGIVRCWDILKYARELMNVGAVNEAGVVAVLAMEELLIPLTGLTHDHVKKERLMLGKIISLVERNKKLHPSQTALLREFGELRIQCAHAITSVARPDQNFSKEVNALIDCLESYPDWLK